MYCLVVRGARLRCSHSQYKVKKASTSRLGSAVLSYDQSDEAAQCSDRKSGATLRYLPKYSPDLNLIELPYSKFKTFLRKLAARTIPGLT
jgi:hypothetical protein